MDAIIKLVGLAGLAGLIICIGYLFYDKQPVISVILLAVGVVLAVYLFVMEVSFKKKRHDAPWLFEKYKGA